MARQASNLGHWPKVPAAVTPSDRVLRVPILMYHRIVDPSLAGDSLPALVVQPRVFAAQMTALSKAGWRTIDMATLARDLATGTAPPAKTFVVTFDDGYADGFTNALPILRRLHFVATYFVVTGRIGLPGKLSSDQVRGLAAAGMEIGDHTVDHVDLPSMGGLALHHQVVDSGLSILQLVGERPVSFAYPFGDVSGRVVSAVREAGFAMAVTNREGDSEAWADRFLVPRVRVGPGTTPRGLLLEMARYAAAG
jgi:peptidoglycan/xylan/chitin deacetylase (PgdA/CDA1 family)